MASSPGFTTDFVTSKDGTRVGYRTLGHGPGVVLLYGSMETAESHMGLAEALADAFTVHLPDRRGRGLTGPYGDDYGIQREVEDLDAVLTGTRAQNVFGVSASGLVVLEAARTLPAIRRAAVYEPALLMADSTVTAWLGRFDREMAEEKVAAALVTSLLGLRLGPPALDHMPRWLLTFATGRAMASEDRKAGPGQTTMRMLAPTLHYEGVLLIEMTGTLGRFAEVRTDVLLLGGSKGLPYLKPALAALETTLPSARRVEFAGLGHGGSTDPGRQNPGGRPEVVAEELRRFFAQPGRA
jgi:pimeloyl-ACP methyl ester carboxylesterase